MKSKLLLKFPNKTGDKPIVYELIKHYNLKLNIIKAAFDFNMEGHVLLEVEGESKDMSAGIKFISDEGVIVEFINSTISIDEGECVSCGVCISACESKALSINKESLELEFDNNKCVGCNLCIKVCPSRAITNGVRVHENF
jgi:ferredoxin